MVAFWGKIFKDFLWDLCGRKSSQRQIDITKYSALIPSRWSGKLAASSQGCHFLTCTVWDCLRFLTTLKSNPPVDSSQWQQGVQGKGTVSSWVCALLNTFLFMTDLRFPFLGTILPAQTHSQAAFLHLLDNFYKQMWGQRFQWKSTFLHFLYIQHLLLFMVFLISLFAKNRKTCASRSASSWSAKIFLILISSLPHHQMNQFCGVFLLGSFYFMLIPTAHTLGTALVLFCCWGTGYSRALLLSVLPGVNASSHPSTL